MSKTTAPSHRRVLLIDDHPAIHDDYRKVFRLAEVANAPTSEAWHALLGPSKAGPIESTTYEIDSAYQGQEAVERVRTAVAEGRPYSLAFIDMRMPPGWDGMQTALRLWEICPDLQVVICTAYSDHSWDEMVELFGQTDRLLLLKKPFDTIEVLQLGQALTEKWRLLQLAREGKERLEMRVAERTEELNAANEALRLEMKERSDLESVMRQSQKMEAVGQLAAGVAHDFNNLLCVIRGYSEMLLRDDKLAKRSLCAVLEMDSAAERAAHLTRQLLTFSRKHVMQQENLNLNEVIDHVSNFLYRLLGETVTLAFEPVESVPDVDADRGMLEQVIVNLAVNARDAMAKGGRLTIRSSVATVTEEEARDRPFRRAGRFVCLSVADCGCGIPPEMMPRLFEPFFTTKEAGKGTGLGLATVHGIVKQHQGWIEVESLVGQGTTFTVFFPESTCPRNLVTAGTAPLPACGGTETILVVEDEPALRDLAQFVLEEYGYRVHLAASGVEALANWHRYAEEVDLLLTDMVMPGGVSGRDLAVRLLEAKPGLGVVYCSGYSPDFSGGENLLEEGRNFIPKPYAGPALASIVRNSLDRCHVRPGLAA